MPPGEKVEVIQLKVLNPYYKKYTAKVRVRPEDILAVAKFSLFGITATGMIMEIPSERKYVTVLFADISEYNRLTDRLDPEDVLKISNQIFRQAAQIIKNYDGYIERVMGDAILAFFGVPATFEDAAVRAVLAALDIHREVKQSDAPILQLAGHPILMHSGISSGLVVTGKTDIERGEDGFAGRPINIASYLKSLSGSDEIFVAHDTYCQTEGFFEFEPLGLKKIKTQIEPIAAYKVLGPKKNPDKLHRVSGLRAEFIGRGEETGKLRQAVERLKQSEKRIFVIVGDAGTGKSRLVRELKRQIGGNGVQWLEGHAYAYRQVTPYFPLRDLLSKIMEIEESDSITSVRERIQSGVNRLSNGNSELLTYIGLLFGLSDKALNSLNPEFVKLRIEASVNKIFNSIAERTPSIFCFEDLHWADKSSVDLLQKLALSMNQPAIFICTQRPPSTFFAEGRFNRSRQDLTIIRLYGLSGQDVQRMLKSILKAVHIPPSLNNFISHRTEGNPLYLEELVNSLIEAGVLARVHNEWSIIGSIDNIRLPSTIHGIMAERFDKLEITVKKILQEAAVIGKNFSPLLLKKISSHKDSIDYALNVLQQYDLIKPRQDVAELEYTLKHALTHEVIYDSMLLKNRRALHHKIGHVLESLYMDRKTEFCETLAYHFARAESVYKAVEYHLQSGKKAAKKYALVEADRHYEKAFLILNNKAEKSPQDNQLLIDVLNQWGHVFYLLENNRKLIAIFKDQEKTVTSAIDKGRQAMFYSWLGLACRERENIADANHYLTTAIKLGEESMNQKAVGLATAWLSFALADMGLIDAAIDHSNVALTMAERLNSQTLYRESMYGLAKGYLCRGNWKKTLHVGNSLIAYGREKADSRALAGGNLFVGAGYLSIGDLDAAINALNQSIGFAPGPTYQLYAKIFLGNCYVSIGKFAEAQSILEEIMRFGEKYGLEAAAEPAKMLSGTIMITNGKPARGLKLLEGITQNWLSSGNKYRYAAGELMLGKIYLQMVSIKRDAFNLLWLIKNLGFVIRVVPYAGKLAELHFSNAAKLAEQMGARMILGQACMGIGDLKRSRGDDKIARDYILKSIRAFEQCEADNFLKQAKDALIIQP